MLVNLSPKNTFHTDAERHAKYLSKWSDAFYQYRREKYKPLKFREIFQPTEYVGVYVSDADENAIHKWTKQSPAYYRFWRKVDFCSETWKEERNAWTYGVADNMEQVIEYYNENADGCFHGNHVIFVKEINKNSCCGWRWHKWGEYIGKQNPCCEYLEDEPEIEKVVCFSIYKVI